MKKVIGLIAIVASGVAIAQQDVPQSEAMSGDQQYTTDDCKLYLPGDQVVPKLEGSPALREKIEAAREMFQKSTLASKAEIANPQSELPEPTTVEVIEAPLPAAEPQPAPSAWSPRPRKKPPKRAFKDVSGGVRIFTRGLKSRGRKREYHSLPDTSFAQATLLFGVAGTPDKAEDVVAELNYAWLGPNGAVVEMTGCRLWLNLVANYSKARLEGYSERMTCTAPNGDTFKVPVVAKVVDLNSEYSGVAGTLLANGKFIASAMEFVTGAVSQFGEAYAATQVKEEVSSSGAFGGSAEKSRNVDGDKYRYVAGKTIAGSSEKFLGWWIDFYKSLSPTIAAGPGSKIFLVVKGDVEVPKVFFKRSITRGEIGQAEALLGKAGRVVTTGNQIGQTNSQGDEK